MTGQVNRSQIRPTAADRSSSWAPPCSASPGVTRFSSQLVHRKQLPLVRNTLQPGQPRSAKLISELSTSIRTVLGQHLICLRTGGDAGTDMNSRAGYRRAPALDLAGMQPARISTPMSRTASRMAQARRTVRAGPSKWRKAVPGEVHLAAAEPPQQAPDAGVMLIEQVSPAAVTEV